MYIDYAGRLCLVFLGQEMRIIDLSQFGYTANHTPPRHTATTPHTPTPAMSQTAAKPQHTANPPHQIDTRSIKWLTSPGTATQKRHAFPPGASNSICGKGERCEQDTKWHRGSEVRPTSYDGCRACLAKLEKLESAPKHTNGPDYCARPVRCEVCPYPQPCDAQTVRAPR